MSKIVIDVEESFHRAVKIAAIESGETMKDFIVRVVLSAVKPDTKKPDFKEALKATMKENHAILKALADK